jgi:hypothetical protein
VPLSLSRNEALELGEPVRCKQQIRSQAPKELDEQSLELFAQRFQIIERHSLAITEKLETSITAANGSHSVTNRKTAVIFHILGARFTGARGQLRGTICFMKETAYLLHINYFKDRLQNAYSMMWATNYT